MKENDFQKYLCERLVKIKSQNPTLYEKAIDVLSFIYKDVRKKFIYGELEKDGYLGSTGERIENAVLNLTEGDAGIIDNLLDICTNEDSRFSDKFFASVSIPLDLFRSDISKNTKKFLYVINIYAILKAYEYNKNDFENYEAIVDDTAFLFIKNISDFINEVRNISQVKRIIEGYVSNSKYKDIKLLRDGYKSYFEGIIEKNNEDDINRLDEMFKMFRDFKTHLDNENRNQRKVSRELEQEIAEDIALLVHPDLLPGVYPYYSRILIYNNRYRYFKENIKVVSPYYRKEVFNLVKRLNIGLFAEINKTSDKDSFETYMDILFDSDTNTELLNKMRMLKMASEKYSSGDKGAALLTLSVLDSEINKEHNGNEIVAFPKENTINKIEKPKTINERMEKLYREKDLIGKGFSLTEQRKSLEEFRMKIFEEMTRHSTAKFASNETDIAKPKQEESALGQQGSNEEPKEKPVEKRLGIFGTRKVKR